MTSFIRAARDRAGHFPPSAGLAFPLLGAAVFISLPLIGVDLFTARVIETVAIFALLVSGLNLTWGYAGELAFGQVAVYAVGAYAAGFLATRAWTDLFLQILLAVVAATVVGFVTGVPGLRLGSWSLAIVTFFLVVLLPDAVSVLTPVTGGLGGLSGIPPASVFGARLDETLFYEAVLLLAVAWFAVLRNILTSRHADALLVLRESPILAATNGIATFRLKLVVYTLGGVPAGVAGCLVAHLNGLVTPDYFSFGLAVSILAASILGGRTSIYGPFAGALIVSLLPLNSASFRTYAPAVYGLALVAFGLFLPEGVAGLVPGTLRGREPRPREEPSITFNQLCGLELRVDRIRCEIAGIVALDGVSLVASAGSVTALVGPNGSGKTTLLNAVSGLVAIRQGSVSIGAQPLSGLPPHVRARRGVGRTFQTPIVPSRLSTLRTVAVARYHHPYVGLLSAALRLPSYRRARRQDFEAAFAALHFVGAAEMAGRDANQLPIGVRRLVEIARALVAEPTIMLLDEPAAGLSPEEMEALGRVVRTIAARGATVLIVEHNVGFVARLADTVYVLDQGKVIAAGEPGAVFADPTVVSAYLEPGS